MMSGPMWMPVQPPTLARVLAWHPQPVPLLPLLVLILLGLYGCGVVVLHRRGVRWPLARTIWWLLGLGIILLVTATGIEGYGMELFSIHMIQHMVLNMLAPVFLVLGAPMTLLLRALPSGTGRPRPPAPRRAAGNPVAPGRGPDTSGGDLWPVHHEPVRPVFHPGL